MKRIAFILVILLITACATTTGQVVEIKDTAAFIKGKTTYNEVVSRFGEPSSMTINSDGTRIITYTHIDTQPNPTDYVLPTIGGVVGAVVPYAGIVTGMIPHSSSATAETTNVTLTFDQKLILIDYTISKNKM